MGQWIQPGIGACNDRPDILSESEHSNKSRVLLTYHLLAPVQIIEGLDN